MLVTSYSSTLLDVDQMSFTKVDVSVCLSVYKHCFSVLARFYIEGNILTKFENIQPVVLEEMR